MHDSQSPDDPDLDGMNEAFDFGEQGQLDAVQTTQKRPLNKSVLMGLGFLVLGTIAGVGYRFLRHPMAQPLTQAQISKQPSQQAAQHTVAHPSQTPIQAPAAQDPVAHSLTPPHSQPSLSTHQQQMPSAPIQPGTLELDKAFAETDKQAPMIPETHKALFAPPHPHTEAMQATSSPSTELIGKLQDALKTLNQQIDSMLAKINYLDSYTHDMSQHLERLNEAIATMDQRLSTSNAIIDQRLSTLTHTTSALSQDVGGVKNQVSQVRDTLKDEGLDRPAVLLRAPFDQPPTPQMVDIENPEYQVHAVIPGRAWLKSTKGTIITVAEGDSLGNYGKVLVIDAAHGLVLTSSGVTFR
jgi:uncharacterized phage infection (PIP) family protein YhgE